MTLNIELPDELSRYVQEQVAKKGYRDASEFLAAVLEAEQHRQLDNEVDRILSEAVDGPFAEWNEQDVEDIRRAGARIIERRKAR